MDWHQHIHSTPEVLNGKPVVKGTRLSVEFILSLFADGWTYKRVLRSYPSLTEESLQAVFACVQSELLMLKQSQEFLRIGNRAVRKAQEESRRLGVPNVYAFNGIIHYERPDGTLTTEDPYEEWQRLKGQKDET